MTGPSNDVPMVDFPREARVQQLSGSTTSVGDVAVPQPEVLLVGRQSGNRDRMTRLLGVTVALAVAILFGTQSNELWLNIANVGLIAAVAAIGLDLLLGHTGLVSVGNAAFLAIGAFTVALLNRGQHFPMIPAILIAGVVCAVVGMVVSLPSLRISGLYFGIATLGFQFAALWGLQEIQTKQVGDSGYQIPTASIFGKQIIAQRDWYILLLIVLAIVLVFYRSLIRRKPGRSLHAIRERPTLASMSGISVWKYKISVFAVSSFIVGIAGGLTAYFVSSVSYANFDLNLGIEYLAIVIVGGLGSTYGAVIGAIFISALPQLIHTARDGLKLDSVISNTEIFLVQGAIVGVVVVLVIVFQPTGLVGLGRTIPRLVGLIRRRTR